VNLNDVVADTGKGIDSSISHRIFEPFFTTKEFGCGSGLGLASVFGIVKNHGGIVDFESHAGRGTTFSVYRPASKETRREPYPVPEGILKGPETVLLVILDMIMPDIGGGEVFDRLRAIKPDRKGLFCCLFSVRPVSSVV
jgi:hypothetical protein